MNTDALNIPAILREVRVKRQRENVANVFKLCGIFCLALFAAWLAMIVVVPDRAAETTGFFAFTFWLLFMGTIFFLIQCFGLFFPFLLYFWANIKSLRQRMLLTLIQTAVEAGKPLQDIIRAYAAGCSHRYAIRLQRLANRLDAGYPLETAIHNHWELFRYDIAGIIRLGGNNSETLRSIENVSQGETNFAPLRTVTIVRIVYLCSLVLWIKTVMSFQLINIIPAFNAIFEDFDVDLPMLTEIIIAASEIFVHYWYLLFPFAFLIALFVIFYLILQTQLVIFRPFGLRRMFRNTDAARFMLVVATGIRRQYPIPAIMKMYRWTVPSNYLRKKGATIQHVVEQGGDWIDAVRRAGFISRSEASLLYSAERTGNTVAILDQLAQSKERAQFLKDDLFSKMVFISLTFMFAAVVGTFVIGMFLPSVELITSLS